MNSTNENGSPLIKETSQRENSDPKAPLKESIAKVADQCGKVKELCTSLLCGCEDAQGVVSSRLTYSRLELFITSPLEYMAFQDLFVDDIDMLHGIAVEDFNQLLFDDLKQWQKVLDRNEEGKYSFGGIQEGVTGLFNYYLAEGIGSLDSRWWALIIFGGSFRLDEKLVLLELVLKGYKMLGLDRTKSQVKQIYEETVAALKAERIEERRLALYEDVEDSLGDDVPSEVRFKIDFFMRYIFLQSEDIFLDLFTGKVVKTAGLIHSLMNKGIFEEDQQGKMTHEIFTNRDLISVVGDKYIPGERKRLIHYKGGIYYNTFRDTGLRGTEGVTDNDVRLWLDHAAWILPTEWEREHLFDILAWKLQNRGQKQNHGVLLAGVPRIGKDLLLSSFIEAFGEGNYSIVEKNDLQEKYQDYIHSKELVIFNEIMGFGGAKDIENKIKPYCAAPPSQLHLRLFGRPHVAIDNIFLPLFMSNHRTALSISKGNDRLFGMWCAPTAKREQEYYDEIWHWLENEGGAAAIIGWLMSREVGTSAAAGKYNPKAPARVTEYVREVQDSSKGELQKIIEEAIASRVGPLKYNVVTVGEVLRWLKDSNGGGGAEFRYLGATRNNVSAAMLDAGAIRGNARDRKIGFNNRVYFLDGGGEKLSPLERSMVYQSERFSNELRDLF